MGRKRSPKSPVTVNKAAEMMGVSPEYIRRLADDGGITCFKTRGGHRRFRVEDIEALMAPADDAA